MIVIKHRTVSRSMSSVDRQDLSFLVLNYQKEGECLEKYGE